MPVDKGVGFKGYAEKTERYSGADIAGLVREAGMIAIRENKKASVVTKEHFEKAFKEIRPSLNKEILDFYKEFTKRFKESYKAEDVKSYLG
jgi:transitional endoplasmic reticulum ATPase